MITKYTIANNLLDTEHFIFQFTNIGQHFKIFNTSTCNVAKQNTQMFIMYNYLYKYFFKGTT